MKPLESLSWKEGGPNFGKRHLAPEGTDETICGLIAPPPDRRQWNKTREDFAAFANDPTSCLNCLEAWLRNRGRELHGTCHCRDPHDVTREDDGTVRCNECHATVEG